MTSKSYQRILTVNEFEEEIENFKMKGKNWNLTDSQINEIIEDSLRILENKKDTIADSTSKTCRVIRKVSTLLVSCVMQLLNIAWWAIVISSILYCILACHNPTQKLVTRHIQDYIYPFMRTFRLFTLPLLKLYPSLVDWHEEQCLVKNPFYKVQNLDCWPCEQVRSVLDLSGLKNFTEYYHHSGIPFVVKDALNQNGSIEKLKDLYIENKEIFKKDAPSVSSSLPWLKSIEDLLDLDNIHTINITKFPGLHVSWKINRIAPARILREAFPRPYFVPDGTEIAIQRFVFINGPESQGHNLPLTDFANVWITLGGDGERLISLWPASQCSHVCSPTSVVLKPGHTFFYNWQYWRPRSLPVHGSKGMTIMFLGSFY